MEYHILSCCVYFILSLNNKPVEAIRKTASVDLIVYVQQNMQKTLVKIEPLILAELLTKIGQKLFTH